MSKQVILSVRFLCLSLVVLALSACQSSTVTPVEEPARAVIDRQQQLTALLSAAERALAADKLMSPSHDNAYDRFRAVLLLQPNNQQAKTGIQQILMRYVQLASAAYGASKPEKAQQLLAKAETMDAQNPLVLELKQRLRDVEVKAVAIDISRDNEISLPAAALARKASSVVTMLAEVAKRMSVSNETVLIRARNDAEGRWIYQQMRRAVPGYRLRGDIQLGSVAQLILQAPID